jgi:hypothetical protein
MLHAVLILIAISTGIVTPLGAQLPVPLPDLRLDSALVACLEVPLDDWHNAPSAAPESSDPLRAGVSLCNVLRSRGPFKSILTFRDGPPEAPFEWGPCYPTIEVNRDDCANWVARGL